MKLFVRMQRSHQEGFVHQTARLHRNHHCIITIELAKKSLYMRTLRLPLS